MKRTSRRASLAVAALLLSLAAPIAAERLYVPLVGGTVAGRPLATSIWVASSADGARRVTADSVVAAGRQASGDVDDAKGPPVDAATAQGATGLLALDLDLASVSAWLAARPQDEPAEVPVIGAQDVYAAGAAPMVDLATGYATARVGAANLGNAPAICRAEIHGDGSANAARFAFAVPPKSFAAVDLAGEPAATTAADAAITSAAHSTASSTVRVTCDQPFYPLAVTADADATHVVVAKASGPNGGCDRSLTLAPQPDGSWLAATNGNFHQATTRNPKGVLCIRAPRTLDVGRAVYDWDVVAGPWWKKRKDGIHNLGYFFGERYRSGVIGNVNTVGTRNQLKFMQNYDMPPGSNTNVSGSYQMQKGARYHVRYTFDAAHELATLELFRGGTLVKSLGQDIHADGAMLRVQPYDGALALIAEFGNYDAKGMPEVPTIGWTYSNFRLRLEPK